MKFLLSKQPIQKHNRAVAKLASLPHHTSHLVFSAEFNLSLILTTNNEKYFFYKFPDGSFLAILGTPYSLSKSKKALFEEFINLPIEESIKLITDTLDGVYCAIALCSTTDTTFIVSDPNGIFPMYSSTDSEGHVILSNEIKPLALLKETKTDLNPDAFVSWLLIGNCYGNLTLIDGIERLSAGSIYHYKNLQLIESHRYWQLSYDSQNVQPLNCIIPDIINLLLDELAAISPPKSHVNLSGGYDSRLIAALLTEKGFRPSTSTVEHTDEFGDLDGYLAISVAKTLGLDHQIIRLDSNKPNLCYFSMNELAHPNLNLFIANIFSNTSEKSAPIWDGLMLGKSFNPISKTWDNIENYINSGLPSGINQQDAKILFQREFYSWLEKPYQDLIGKLKEKYGFGHEGILAFMFDGRLRHRVGINATNVLGNTAQPLILGTSRQFLSLVGQISFEARTNGACYEYIYDNYFPNLSRIPFISGGKFKALSQPSYMARVNCHLRKKVLGHWRIKQLMGHSRHHEIELTPNHNYFHLNPSATDHPQYKRLSTLAKLFEDIFVDPA